MHKDLLLSFETAHIPEEQSHFGAHARLGDVKNSPSTDIQGKNV